MFSGSDRADGQGQQVIVSTAVPGSPGKPAAQARIRDALTIALTLVTGATDAIAFTRLGGTFTSVMTGNMVLLGVAVGRVELVSFEHVGLAVLAFIAGTVAGAHIAGAPRADDPVWPRQLSVALGVELAIFAAVAVGWWASGSDPTGLLQSVALAASAFALGIQSSAVLRLNVSGLSTTYLTGTLTTLVQTVTTTRRLKGGGRSLCLLIALVSGAAIGTVLASRVPVAAPVVPLLILTTVIGVAEFKILR
jgi:uncharacterized membrane protein YoaK (UPF0700 family)